MRKSYDTNYMGDRIQIIYRENGDTKRFITIKIGDTLSVQPDNPLNTKHRGRSVIVKDFHMDDIGYPIDAIVTFTDNNRTGKIDLKDLVAL